MLPLNVILLGLCCLIASCVSLFTYKPSGIEFANEAIEISSGLPLNQERLMQRLSSAKVILIGEKHDHPDHHKIQSQIIAMLNPDLVEGFWFEQFDRTQQQILDTFNQSSKTARELRDAVNWDKSGWPDWALYEPLFSYALKTKRPIYAANIDSSALASLMRVGYEIVFKLDTIKTLKLKQPLANDSQTKLADMIEKAHCHPLAEPLKAKMVRAQRSKDAFMAQSLGLPSDGGLKVLIAGNGHVRRDWGVGHYLELLGYEKKDILSIGVIEGSWDKNDLESYPYDIVFFTDVYDKRDPCEIYKNSLQKFKENKR